MIYILLEQNKSIVLSK